MIDLGDLPGGDDWSSATGINSFGQVAGDSETSPDNRAFLWNPEQPNGDAGSLANLGNLPAGRFYDTSSAYGINSLGQVVGYSQVDGTRAFVWNPVALHATTGIMFDLNGMLDPVSGAGWSLAEAHAINDVGQIVGFGFFDPDGSGPALSGTRAYLLTPKAIPEPSTTVLITSILVLLVAVSSHSTARHTQRPAARDFRRAISSCARLGEWTPRWRQCFGSLLEYFPKRNQSFMRRREAGPGVAPRSDTGKVARG